jgi:pimeloyl-ACP methyl ester carboxylesterase
MSTPRAGRFAFHCGPLPAEPRSAKFAEVGGARVRYVDLGEGPAVVLVHGFASSLDTWAHVAPMLARRHRVLAFDLKGFGWSDRPEGDYSPRAQAELLLEFLAWRGVDRAALVGHSFGASVVLQAALLMPLVVDRLALYDAFVYQEQLPSFFHWSRIGGVGEALFALFYRERPEERIRLAFHDRRFVTPHLVDDVERALDRPGTLAAALETVRACDYTAIQARYRSVSAPALILWGREDRVTPLAFGQRLARDLVGARFAVYPHCGHFPMIEGAKESTSDLAEFLAAPAEALAPRESEEGAA